MCECTHRYTEYDPATCRAWPRAAGILRWQRTVLRYEQLRRIVAASARAQRARETTGRCVGARRLRDAVPGGHARETTGGRARGPVEGALGEAYALTEISRSNFA